MMSQPIARRKWSRRDTTEMDVQSVQINASRRAVPTATQTGVHANIDANVEAVIKTTRV